MVGNAMNARVAGILAATLALGLPAGAMAQQVPVVVPGGAAVVAEDEVLWGLAQQRGTADAYRNYMTTFPNGAHVPEARARLGQILAGSPPIISTPLTPAPQVPADQSPADASRAEVGGSPSPAQPQGAAGVEAGMTLQDRRAVQAQLTRLGYDTRGVDGVFGSGTRRAIGAWQTSRNYASTGYVTRSQLDELRAGLLAPVPSTTPSPSPSTPALPVLGATAASETALGLTPTQRRIIQSRLTQLGYDTRGIDGAFGSGTRRAITAWQQAKGVAATGYLTQADADALMNAGTTPVVPPAANADSAASAELALNLSSKDRQDVQRGLMAAGHDTRGADGTFGSGTRRAIRDWQAGRGAPVTGYLNAEQFRLLAGRAGAEPTPPSMPTLDAGASAEDEAALNLGPMERTEIQSRLSVLGYDPNGIDGQFGSGARRAIKRWQGDNGLEATGYLNADQLARLRGQRRN